MERSSSNLRISQRFSSWPTALIGIIVIKAVLSLALKPGSSAFSYSGISYFLLLVLAESFAIRNAIQNTLGSRSFWVFLAIGYALWLVDQWILVYYALGLHSEVPDNSIADPLLFLHVVPFLAALAVFPHRNLSERAPYRAVLDALLLLFFWAFLYGYDVFPHQYLARPTDYALRFDILYGLENLSLVLAAGILTLRGRGAWKSIYFHLFGASALYAVGSAVANLAIDSGGYVNGKVYGLALTASVCWFVWIPLRARQLSSPEADVTQASNQSRASSWAMVVVVLISIPIVWELYHRETRSTWTFRLLLAILAIVCIACTAYIREHLVRSELASRLGFTSHRLRLAMKCGKTVAWEWDIKSGRDSWFGDLQTQFGIPSDTYVGRVEDFHHRIHPEDRELVAKAVKDAMKNRTSYSAEFRIPQPDGTVRWVSAEGEFIYAENGEPVRMLGISVDITQRKWAEDALSHVNRKLIEAQELERTRIARELHDDFGQRLALLEITLDQVQSYPADAISEVQTGIVELRKQVREISTDMQALAHELHSSKLDILGVATAMRSFCKEFGDQLRMEVVFKSHDVPSPISSEVSLSLFRVLQEALRNTAKHSGVHRVEVHLWGTTDAIHLTVSDCGVGFDTKTTRDGRGLGLTSMQERMKLVNGNLSIESRPMRGTTISARVPNSPDGNSQRATG